MNEPQDESVKSPETPPAQVVPDSGLGRDEDATGNEAVDETEDVDSEEPGDISGQDTPQDPRLPEKAAAFDFIMQDPALASLVNDQINIRLGRKPASSRESAKPVEKPGTSDTISRSEFEELRLGMRQLVETLATERLQTFKNAHPDLVNELEVRTGQIISQYGLPLEQAYLLAKAQMNGGVPAGVQRKAAVLPSEAGPGGRRGRSETKPDHMQEARKKIERLPRTPRRFEDALDIALRAAMKGQE